MSALRTVEAERGPGRLWVIPDPPARERTRLVRVVPAAVWLAAAVAGATLGERPEVGLVLIAAVVVGEWLASRDDYGSKALSGGIGMFAVLLLGWPAGVVTALGAVAFGDVLLRGVQARRALWWAVLLATMLSAGAWAVGARGTMPTPAWISMAIAAASFLIFGAWTVHRVEAGRLREGAVGTVILVLIGAALLGPLWMPGLSEAVGPWVGAGMTGMGLSAAFMLTDMAVASSVAWRADGLRALAFWPQHMPVLFGRYAGQGIAAGLAAYAFTLGGAPALLLLLSATFCGQWLHRLYREGRALLDSTVGALAAAVDARDAYTAGHSARVAEYGARVAVDLGWPKAMVERTRTAGLLHDVGKLGGLRWRAV
ncbi:MAG: HD domain-containing protein [Dehalococcoidia bacterium]|nr:HD domain-containing protein [Dehalococcoidia bacterium]